MKSKRPLIFLLLLLPGCMSPIVADEKEPGGDEVVVVDDRENSPAGNAVSFSMDAEQFANLAAWLGHENTLTIEKPVHVEKDNVTLDAKAGTRFSYEMGDNSGRFTFEKPYPTVKAGIAKLIGGVSLHTVDINADGSGLAATGLGKYRFRWMEDETSERARAGNNLPEVWCYECSGFCNLKAKNELKKAKEDFKVAAEKGVLPFTPVWKSGDEAPNWMPSQRPAFWWSKTKDQPSQKDIGDTLRHNGYENLKDFLDRWIPSRPKPSGQAKDETARHRPFVRPDHNSVRALVFHASHDCPSCGQAQYDIANNSGPNHTHRCNSCGTSWYHADARSSLWRAGR